MKSALFTLAAALLLGAPPALAGEPYASDDNVSYPDQPTLFATCVDSEPFVSDGVVYEGTRGVVLKSTARMTAFSLLTDDGGAFPEERIQLKEAPVRAAPPADTRLAMCSVPDAG